MSKTKNRGSFVLPSDIVELNAGIKNRLLAPHQDPVQRTFYFCSFSAREGTTTVALSFALTLSQCYGCRTLFVADRPKRRDVPRLMLPAAGRPQADESEPPDEDCFPSRYDNLYLAVCESGSAGTGPSADLGRLLADQADRFDVVLIDGRPLEQVQDLSAVRDQIGGVVMVVEVGKVRIEILIDAVDRLRAGRVPILGCILNKKRKTIPEFIYKRL